MKNRATAATTIAQKITSAILFMSLDIVRAPPVCPHKNSPSIFKNP